MFGRFAGYKGYIGTIKYDEEDNLYYGELIGIKDIVAYHSRDIVNLYDKYIDAINLYEENKLEGIGL